MSAIKPLTNAQMQAVQPADNVWLSASAGTGKTQVLTARVIRLLLEPGVRPENLLCITFTKAGAAEMAERINQRLASWVQLKGTDLGVELQAIGADYSPEGKARARKLFASVLDAPGGGLQILTIHSLCQSLLGSFPEEAGLIPGFKPVEGREQNELYRFALSEMIVAAEQCTGSPVITNLQELSIALGEGGALNFLRRCAAQPDAMANILDDQGAILQARRITGVTFEGPVGAMLEQACGDSQIDRQTLLHVAEMNEAWSKGKPDSRGMKRALIIRDWLSDDISERAAGFEALHRCWSKADGEPLISSKGFTPPDDVYGQIALELYQWTSKIVEQVKLAAYAERLANALIVGKEYAAAYADSKRQRGLVDFDDMIRKTAALLNTSGMADWVRYKLDRQIDHILIDEAQDTNLAQWNIVKALSEDFFSGITAKEDRSRTVFSVGDYKQAIFGFQGTDPEKYRQAGNEFADRIGKGGATLERLALSQSFRSTQPVLDFVNAVMEQAGPERFGISDDIEDHVGAKPDIGMIELFAPVTPKEQDDAAADDEENWLTTEKRVLAHRIAAYVKRLCDDAPLLASTGKPLVPGNIMILLRNRSDLASSIVARLHGVGVPVAGIDRLKLLEPIAVQDMLACIRFVLQPGDDLSLACILVSPLIGWSQDDLLKYGYRRPGLGLWQHLRGQEDIAEAIQPLRDMLASADFTTPYHFLETILSGPIQGRKKMVARLGQETLVPIEELLNAALQFEQNNGGTLQRFLRWFESGDAEIKREGVASNNEVRVMTVHGAKGLQAPVVILADVTADPSKKPDRSVELLFEDGARLPILPITKNDRIGRLEEAAELQEEREKAEHFRLLYVAITRAEERLVMAGALGKQSRGEAKADSWYPALLAAMEALGAVWEEELPWGRLMRYNGSESVVNTKATEPAPAAELPIALPEWLARPAPEERRPPRPLVPSQLGDDDYGDAPATLKMQTAAEKGRLVHALFERLTGDDVVDRLAHAQTWLERNNRDPAIRNDAILDSIKSVITNPDWQAFFGPAARAEVPLAAVVGETVISGRVDRLVVEPGLVRVLDFKTGRNVPAHETEVQTAYLRQMAHYVAALEMIFPGRKVEASLLFTFAPKLFTLSDAILAPHKPVL